MKLHLFKNSNIISYFVGQILQSEVKEKINDFLIIDANKKFCELFDLVYENSDANPLKASILLRNYQDLFSSIINFLNKSPIENQFETFEFYLPNKQIYIKLALECIELNNLFYAVIENITNYKKTNINTQTETNKFIIQEIENAIQLKKDIEKVAKMGSWEYDIEKNKLTWSDEIYNIFEIDKAKTEPSYQLFINSVHPDDREFVEKAYNESLTNKTKYDIEHRLLFNDGRIKYVREMCDTFYDENGKAIRSIGIVQDITDKISKDKIVNQLSMAVKQSSSMILMTDQEGRIEYVNDKFTEITGYTLEEIKGKTPKILKSGKHSKEFYKKLWNTIKSGKVWIGEMYNKKKNGEYYWESEKIYPILDNNGKITNFVAIKDDITQQKYLEQKVEENETNFYNIFYNSEIPMLILEKDRFIDANRAAIKLLGYNSVDDLIGKHPAELSPKYQIDNIESYEKANQMIDLAYRNGYHRFEWVHIKKDGELVYFDISLTHIIIKGKSYLYCVWFDITDRKKIEKEILLAKAKAEEKENKLLTFINSIPDIVCYKDGNGRWLLANQADLDLFQLTNVNYFGLTDEQLADFTHQMYREAFKTCMVSDEIAWEKGTISKGIEKIPTIDGNFKIYDVYKIPVFNEDGTRKGLAVIGRDITDLMKTQEELIKAKEKAEESDRLKSAFLANMSHEIRTPLNGILGFAELLLLPNITDKKRLEYINLIKKSGQRLLSTINDLLDISRIEAGMVQVNLTQISLSEILDYCYSFFKPETDAKGISYIVNNYITDSNFVFVSDKEKIYAILTNLIKNAIKFTNNGSIEVGVSLENNKLKIYVKDTGIGIPEDKLDKIFERFEQVNNNDYSAKKGTGLGLAIVKAYVEMLGGKITVESKLGEGAIFYCDIPLNLSAQKELGKINTSHSITDNKNSNLSILIVEDDEISSILLETSLKKITDNITKVSNGEDAVNIVKNNNNKFDVILMDMGLPKLNGYDATSEIRKFNKDIIIIAQSAYALNNEQEKALKAGCNYFISKPIEIKSLYELLHQSFPKKVNL